HQRQPEQRQRVKADLGHGDAGMEVVDGVLQHPRAGQADERGDDDAQEAGQELEAVAGRVAQQATRGQKHLWQYMTRSGHPSCPYSSCPYPARVLSPLIRPQTRIMYSSYRVTG